MTVKKTYRDIIEYDSTAKAYLTKLDGTENKLTYAIMKTSKKLSPVLDKISDEMNKIRLKHCLVDESKKEKPIMKDQHKELCFSKEGMTASNEEINKSVLGDTEYEIEPYYATAIPDNLTQFEKEAFKGFVIDPALLQEE